MSAARFSVCEDNPNDSIGGGGCVCGESKQTECAGPYLVFPGVETDSRLSPHVVISQACVIKAAHAVGLQPVGVESANEDDPFAV